LNGATAIQKWNRDRLEDAVYFLLDGKRMHLRLAVMASALVAFACTSCSRAPSDGFVRTEFLREHPSFRVESVGVEKVMAVPRIFTSATESREKTFYTRMFGST
jgi:hypothetical protein